MLAGLVMAWRLATWPTSRSPVLVKATTEGTVRPPSALGMTVGSPPSMTATTELVVPRSMPMILPMVSRCLRIRHRSRVGQVEPRGRIGRRWCRVAGSLTGVGGDGDERRAQDPITDAIAPLDLGDDGAVGHVGGLFLGERLVLARVERLAQRLDGRHALRLEQHGAACGRWPRCPRPSRRRPASGIASMARSKSSAMARTLRSSNSLARPARRLALLVGAALVVREVGRGALQGGQVLGRLLDGGVALG